MNTNLGLLGKKLGNTQLFNDDGSVTPVTVVEAGPCMVVGKRTTEKDGYAALVLGLGKAKAKGLSKAETKHWEKAGVEAPETVREFRVSPDDLGKFEVGQVIKISEVLSEGQLVDVAGTSKGRGFTGVLKRWNFSSPVATHGTHEYKRHGGSIGTNLTPGRTFLNLKMAGHYGAERVTMPNVRIARIDDEQQLVMIAGSVPGSKNGIVEVRGQAKARKKAQPKN
ncbi:MAG: 50S ribosomal protein L3 [Polyangiales bacterium]